MSPGSLTVVGTGISLGVQMTPEARAAAEGADELLYLVYEPAAAAWTDSLNPNARSLLGLYREGAPRQEIYEAIVEEILGPVRAGRTVCAAFYGHPGVFVHPSHEAIRRARAEGFSARMLPGISAEDCLFADLGVDPGVSGCHSYEATDFLLRGRSVDTTAVLLLWQAGMVGDVTQRAVPSQEHLPLLRDYLLRFYPPGHEVVVYEASAYPVAEARVERITVAELGAEPLAPLVTLYLAPLSKAEDDPETRRRLGLD